MTWSNEPLECLIDTLESGSRPTGGASTDSGEVLSIGGENILQSGGVTRTGAPSPARWVKSCGERACTRRT